MKRGYLNLCLILAALFSLACGELDRKKDDNGTGESTSNEPTTTLPKFNNKVSSPKATTCIQAVEIVKEKCKDTDEFVVNEDSVDACNAAENKEEIIDCTNAGDCDQIFKCTYELNLENN